MSEVRLDQSFHCILNWILVESRSKLEPGSSFPSLFHSYIVDAWWQWFQKWDVQLLILYSPFVWFSMPCEITNRFLLKFTGKEEEINLLGDGSEKPEFGEWSWMAPEQIVEHVSTPLLLKLALPLEADFGYWIVYLLMLFQAVDFKKPVYKKVLEVFTPYLHWYLQTSPFLMCWDHSWIQ